MVGTPPAFRSLHGKDFGLTPRGLEVYGRSVGSIDMGGDIYYVSSTASNATDGGDGKSPARPFATLDYAIGRCTANNNDIIVVMANHAETITGASGLDFDVAGITVIGVGEGDQRPRFLMDAATTVTADIAAADVTLENLVFAAGHADIVRCIQVQSTGATLRKLEFVENTAGENFLIPIDCSGTTDNECDGLTVEGCRSIGLDAAATEFIALAADIDRLTVRENFVVQSGSTDGALIKQATGKDMTLLDCRWNFVQHAMTAGDLLIDNDTTANTGIVAHNRCRHADVTSAHSLIDCDGVGLFDNLSTSVDTASGFVLPAIDTDA